MARYQQKIFDAFGRSAIGQTAASIVIGALAGFVYSRKSHVTTAAGIATWTLGAAALGLAAALVLLLIDRRRKRVQAGVAKPHGVLFWIAMCVLGLVLLFVGLIVFAAVL